MPGNLGRVPALHSNTVHCTCSEAIIIEWFDRAQSLPYEITMPTQGKGPTTSFGTWPVKYRGIPCPVGDRKMQFQFLDFSKPVRRRHA